MCLCVTVGEGLQRMADVNPIANSFIQTVAEKVFNPMEIKLREKSAKAKLEQCLADLDILARVICKSRYENAVKARFVENVDARIAKIRVIIECLEKEKAYRAWSAAAVASTLKGIEVMVKGMKDRRSKPALSLETALDLAINSSKIVTSPSSAATTPISKSIVSIRQIWTQLAKKKKEANKNSQSVQATTEALFRGYGRMISVSKFAILEQEEAQISAHKAFEAVFDGDVEQLRSLLDAPRNFPLAYTEDALGHSLIGYASAPIMLSAGGSDSEASRPSEQLLAMLLASAAKAYSPLTKRVDPAWDKPAGHIDNILLLNSVINRPHDDSDDDSDAEHEAINMQLGQGANARALRAVQQAAREKTVEWKPGSTSVPVKDLLESNLVLRRGDHWYKLTAFQAAVAANDPAAVSVHLSAARQRPNAKADICSDAVDLARSGLDAGFSADSLAALQEILRLGLGGIDWRAAAKSQRIDLAKAFAPLTRGRHNLRNAILDESHPKKQGHRSYFGLDTKLEPGKRYESSSDEEDEEEGNSRNNNNSGSLASKKAFTKSRPPPTTWLERAAAAGAVKTYSWLTKDHQQVLNIIREILSENDAAAKSLANVAAEMTALEKDVPILQLDPSLTQADPPALLAAIALTRTTDVTDHRLSSKRSLLHLAVESGSTELVSLMLDQQAESPSFVLNHVSSSIEPRYLLLQPTLSDQMLQFLLENGADPEKQLDADSNNMLHKALLKGELDKALGLAELIGKVCSKTVVAKMLAAKDSTGRTALMMAVGTSSHRLPDIENLFKDALSPSASNGSSRGTKEEGARDDKAATMLLRLEENPALLQDFTNTLASSINKLIDDKAAQAHSHFLDAFVEAATESKPKSNEGAVAEDDGSREFAEFAAQLASTKLNIILGHLKEQVVLRVHEPAAAIVHSLAVKIKHSKLSAEETSRILHDHAEDPLAVKKAHTIHVLDEVYFELNAKVCKFVDKTMDFLRKCLD